MQAAIFVKIWNLLGLVCLCVTYAALALHLTRKVTSPLMIRLAMTVDTCFAQHAMTFPRRKHQSVRVIRPAVRSMSELESSLAKVITAQPMEIMPMRARFSEQEVDMLEEALILYGAHQMRNGYGDAAKAVSEVIKKIQTVQIMSPQRSVLMEPVK